MFSVPDDVVWALIFPQRGIERQKVAIVKYECLAILRYVASIHLLIYC